MGCGTGNHATELRARGLRVVGVDTAPGMLQRASRKDVTLVRADPLHVPGRDSAADAVLSVYSAQFFELDAYFGEVRRLLAHGGRLLVELPRRVSSPPRPTLSMRFRAFQRVKNVMAAVGTRVGHVHLYETDELDNALAASGFTVLERRSSDRNFAVLARAT